MEVHYQLDLERPFLLVTYHPVTLEYEDTEWQIDQLLMALREAAIPVIFTAPNADTANRIVRDKIQRFLAADASSRLVDNFGSEDYHSIMTLAAAMVGNSSSGVVEAASFALPVVNVGTRQRGRVRACNVIDVGYSRAEVFTGIKQATDPRFRSLLTGIVNPYGSGNACPIIVRRLKETPLGAALIRKKFYDLPASVVSRKSSQ